MTPEESILEREIKVLTEARNTMKHVYKSDENCLEIIQIIIAKKVGKLVILRQGETEFEDSEITGGCE